jgi:Xaa-Pro aminopeptidase
MVERTRELDLARMRRDRHARLQREMRERGVDALLLLTSGNVMYATGARHVMADNGRTYQLRNIALVLSGAPAPHLFTPLPEGAPVELPADHLHPALWPETDEGVEDMARRLKDVLGGFDVRSLAVDDFTAPMYFGLPSLLAPVELVEAGTLLTHARLHKTTDELECMRRSWEINEAATSAAEQILRPGVRLTDLSGAFFRRLFELGATSNFLDPVFQAMPDRIADGPWSTNGDVPFNLVTTDHIISDREVIWTDTVTSYEGYASDVGRTWVAGRPSTTVRRLYETWQEITDAVIAEIKPGVSGDVLTRVATERNGGKKPWLDHFFLAHGLGLEGGEPQQIGSDRGQEYDEQFIFEPGMAIVVEPVTWKEGHAGWRCEELVFVTDDGCELVSHYPNEPFQ